MVFSSNNWIFIMEVIAFYPLVILGQSDTLVNSGVIEDTLPTIVVDAKLEDERTVLQRLANDCDRDYANIFYIDCMLDYVQDKYGVPASICWGILWEESKVSIHYFSYKVKKSFALNVKLGKEHVKEEGDYDFIWGALFELAKQLNNDCWNEEGTSCGESDYGCWLDRIIVLYNQSRESEPWNRESAKNWKKKILDIIDKYDLVILNDYR